MRIFVVSLLLLFTTGCAKVVDDFVTGGDPATPSGPIDEDDADTSNQLKLSPGMVRTNNLTGVNMTARITPSRHAMTSTHVNAVIGLHKTR